MYKYLREYPGFILSGITFVSCELIFYLFLVPKIQALTGNQPLDLLVSLNSSILFKVLDNYNIIARTYYILFQLIDYTFIVSYVVFFSICLKFLYRNFILHFKYLSLIKLLPIATAFFDTLENLLLMLLVVSSVRNLLILSLVNILIKLKFIMAQLTILLIVLGSGNKVLQYFVSIIRKIKKG